MYPEYTGVFLSAVAEQTKLPTSAAEAYKQAKAFADGMIYFNVHTAENKGGEIRGQLAPAK